MRKIFQTIMALAIAGLICVPASAQEKTIKRKVAIGKFTNETSYGKGLFYDKENDPMRKQALDILSAKLAATGKFILLERDNLEVLVQEAGSDMSKIGADYIILGSITEFGRHNEGTQKVFSSSKTQTVEAGVSMRLVEASSGLIIYSDEAKGFAETTSKTSFGVGGTADYDASLSDKAISAAIGQLVENIVNKCMDKPWRSYILDIDEGVYMISGGASQGLTVGDTFSVYAKGKTVTNPQSGIKVELPGKKVGVVTVTMTLGDTPDTEFSMCEYVGDPISKEELAKYYVSDK